MTKFVASLLLAIAIGAAATAAPAQQPFTPITIDAAKYQQIDEAVSKLSMPREAHAAWLRVWQEIERQAQIDANVAAAAKKAAADAPAKSLADRYRDLGKQKAPEAKPEPEAPGAN